MTQLGHLSYLDVAAVRNVDNSLLEKALHLENRKITINCNDTSISSLEFEKKYVKATKTRIDVNLYRYKWKNLTFEASYTQIIRKPVVLGDHAYYLEGYSSSDSFDFDDILDNDDHIPGDDLDFLDENENEMLNELDEGESDGEDW